MVVVVECFVVVASVVVRVTTETLVTVADGGVTVTVVVGPLQGVVIVEGAKIRVWVSVPMVVKTATK